jgi:uncharacterized membrane protein
MSSRATIAKHPIHPMLVVFPIGLWVFSLVSDLMYLFNQTALWSELALYAMVGGLIGAIGASVPGLIDMLAIRDIRVRKIARDHMILNASAIVIFGLNLLLRVSLEPGAPLPILLSFAGILVVAVSGWLGGEMVYIHGVGVVEPRSKPGAAQKERNRGNLRRIG